MKVNFKKISRLIFPGLAAALMVMNVSAAERIGEHTPQLLRLDTGQFSGNRINDDLENNGMVVSHRLTGHSGMEWPAGTNKYSNFASGVWFAGKVGGSIRTAVGEYGPEFVPGPWGSDYSADEHQLYIVNKSDLANPLENSDFQNWPADLGAPWVDVDGDGVYSPLPNGPDHPEFIGDQVIWYVMNDGDVATHSNIFGTLPLGIEVRMTIWGYNRPDAFGDMMFIKVQAFNKAGNDITDMFIGLWDDPDLGYAGDDFVGSDTTLSLGFCYNDGSDNDYGDEAPAIGYDFFQAAVPGSPTDSTFAFGELKGGFRKLEMSSFVKYINGDPVYADPNDATEAYNYMSGLRRDGTPFINSATGQPSKFIHPCDPNDNVDGNDDCWVDSDDHASGDRRFLMNVGPFDFMAGDSLELVFGIMHAQASDALSSVSLLKQVDELAQLAYDINFALPPSPPQPNVTVTATNEEIILEWDNIAESYVAEDELILDEDGNPTFFHFEGYNVWQHDNLSGSGSRQLIATFDLINGVTEIYDNVFDPNYGVNVYVPVQYGTDSGIKRWIHIDKDKLNGGVPLVDDRAYYFTVNAYGYNPVGIPKTLESPDNIFMVRPQKDVLVDPAVETGYSDIEVIHEGPSDGSAEVVVVNPYDVTGDEYEIYFEEFYVSWEEAVELGWAEGPDCAGQYVLAGEDWLNLEDCAGACYPADDLTPLLGDGVCDDGTSPSGIDLNCVENGFDMDDCLTATIEGTCYSCDSDECVWDCALVCVDEALTIVGGPDTWNGDGYCDDGSYGLDLMCTEFGFDQGDCDGDTVNEEEYQAGKPHYYPSNDYPRNFLSGNSLARDYDPNGVMTLGWHVRNLNTGEVVVENQTVQSGFNTKTEETDGIYTSPVFDGIQVRVNGPSNGIHGIYMVHDGETAHEDYSDLPLASALQEHVWLNYSDNLVYLENSNGGYYFATQGGGTPASEESYYERVFRGSNFSRAIPYDFEMRFTDEGGECWLAYSTEDVVQVPFELWNVGINTPDDPSDDYRMICWIFDVNGDNVYGWSGDLADSGAENDPGTDWVYWRNPVDTSPGTAGYDATVASGYAYPDFAGSEVMARTIWNNWNGYGSEIDSIPLADLSDVDPANWTAADTSIFLDRGWFLDDVNSLGVVEVSGDYAYGRIILFPATGSVYRWITNKPNSTSDVFRFDTGDISPFVHSYDCEDINVWPNPYYAYNPEERSPVDYQLHFTDLPDNATIRIYNMAGHLVRKLEHSGGQNEIWDLKNAFDIPVASGMYIAVVETIGCEKALKIAVVMPEQRIDVY